MRRLITAMLLCTVMLLSGCVTMGERHPTAVISFSDGGEIKFRLYPEYAPNTVANFIALANSGFYDGSPVHRIREYFVIQMGKPADGSSSGAGYNIKGEFPNNGFSQNSFSHLIGTVSMARTDDFDSACSQFFICTRNQIHLDGDYAAFGRITEEKSLDQMIKIARMDTIPETEEPRDEIYIVTVRVNTFGKDYGKPDML